MMTERNIEFAIIGAAKSASTWLHLALRQHPAIYMPGTESAFFEDPFYDPKDLSPLRTIVAEAPSNTQIGIKCPNYLCSRECAPRLAHHLPEIRMIAILRNPIDRAISQYYHLIRSGRLPVAPADAAFQTYLRGEFDPPFAKKLILDFGNYGAGLQVYRQHFSADRLLVLTDIELSADRQEVFRRACRFLGVSDDFMPATIALPRNQGVYFTPILSAIQRLNSIGFTFDPRLGTERIRPGVLPSFARRLAIMTSRASALLRHFVHDQEPAVSAEVRAKLLEHYRSDVKLLEVLTGLDLQQWTQLHLPVRG